MRAVVSVMGVDRTGIIAKVSTCLYENEINILDINQTIMQNIFTMVMLVEFSKNSENYSLVTAKLDELGKELGVEIRMQNEEIFNSMHRI